MKREFKKLPEGMTVAQMEEIFTDRLANLIVQLLDYQYEQKLKVKNNEKKEEPKI
jgi:hypothetical protein